MQQRKRGGGGGGLSGTPGLSPGYATVVKRFSVFPVVAVIDSLFSIVVVVIESLLLILFLDVGRL